MSGEIVKDAAGNTLLVGEDLVPLPVDRGGTGLSELPFVSLLKDGHQSIDAGTWTKITGWTEIADTGNDWASDEFVAPATGKYDFRIRLAHDTTNADAFVVALWKWDGAAFAALKTVCSVRYETITNCSIKEMLTAGDRIALYVYQSTGGAASIYADAAATGVTIDLVP